MSIFAHLYVKLTSEDAVWTEQSIKIYSSLKPGVFKCIDVRVKVCCVAYNGTQRIVSV